MEYPQLSLALNNLAVKLRQDLVNELNIAGHNETGALANSIVFQFTVNNTGAHLHFNALEYIKYLDNGTFLSNFMDKAKKEIAEVTAKALIQDITNEITN